MSLQGTFNCLQTNPSDAARIVENLIWCRTQIHLLQVTLNNYDLKPIISQIPLLALQKLGEELFPNDHNNEIDLGSRIEKFSTARAIVKAINSIQKEIFNLDFGGKLILNLSLMRESNIYKFEEFKSLEKHLREYILNFELMEYKVTTEYNNFIAKVK